MIFFDLQGISAKVAIFVVDGAESLHDNGNAFTGHFYKEFYNLSYFPNKRCLKVRVTYVSEK